MMHDDYDGFGVRIQEEGNRLMAHFIELPEVAACGATVTDALIELKAVWEATKEIYIKRDRSVPLMSG
jgi:predicted RNase H-like HicB family nuclease